HAVAVGVQLDRAVGLHPAHQLAYLAERRATVERPQGAGLVAPEPLDWCLAGGAVHAPVGDLARPPRQMRLERRPAGEAVAGDGVALHIADAALVLALGARPVRRAGARPEAPVAGEGLQPGIELDLPGERVMVLDQGAGVVQEDLLGNPREGAERRLDAVEPGRLPLVAERLHI